MILMIKFLITTYAIIKDNKRIYSILALIYTTILLLIGLNGKINTGFLNIYPLDPISLIIISFSILFKLFIILYTDKILRGNLEDNNINFWKILKVFLLSLLGLGIFSIIIQALVVVILLFGQSLDASISGLISYTISFIAIYTAFKLVFVNNILLVEKTSIIKSIKKSWKLTDIKIVFSFVGLNVLLIYFSSLLLLFDNKLYLAIAMFVINIMSIFIEVFIHLVYIYYKETKLGEK